VAGRSPIAIIAFDMFETLVHNSVDQWLQSFVAIVEDQALSISPQVLHREWTSREIDFRKGRTNLTNPKENPPFRSYHDAWMEAFQQTFTALGLNADARAATDRCVAELGKREAFPSVAETLGRLRERWTLGILSNADDNVLLPVMAYNGWSIAQGEGPFQIVVSSESAGAYKPDLRIFTAFCRKASVAPERVLYVGDSPYDDIHGAKLAGMQAAWVRRAEATPGRTPAPEHRKLLQADYEVGSLGELGELLVSTVAM
jgi:2-haloalkanoic acid dehalogenase type II